jgi:hypothetical protein
VSCDLWHAGRDHLICVDSRSSKQNLRLQVRSLTDGQIRWSLDTGGSGGEALDANGRLMVANQGMVYEEITTPSNRTDPYGVINSGYSTRNTRLTILDLADGRVLATMDLPMLKPLNRGVQPDFEFDGERVLMRLRDVPGCPETSLQTYRLDLTRGLFQSSAECESIRYPSPPPEPVWTDAERVLGFRMQPLKDSTLVSSSPPNATLFEQRSPRVQRWQVIQPFYNSSENSWHFEQAHEQEGFLFLESNAWHFGTLDSIDLASGRPLWRYVFPSVTVLHSINFVSPPGLIGRFYENDWRALQRNAPPPLIGLIRPLTLDEQLRLYADTVADLPRHAAAPTTFDPAAVQPWPVALAVTAVILLPIGAGAGLLVPSWRERLAPRGSLRRVFIGLVLLIYLLMAACSVETSRLTWLVRGSLVLFLLFIGAASLFLI